MSNLANVEPTKEQKTLARRVRREAAARLRTLLQGWEDGMLTNAELVVEVHKSVPQGDVLDTTLRQDLAKVPGDIAKLMRDAA